MTDSDHWYQKTLSPCNCTLILQGVAYELCQLGQKWSMLGVPPRLLQRSHKGSEMCPHLSKPRAWADDHRGCVRCKQEKKIPSWDMLAKWIRINKNLHRPQFSSSKLLSETGNWEALFLSYQSETLGILHGSVFQHKLESRVSFSLSVRKYSKGTTGEVESSSSKMALLGLLGVDVRLGQPCSPGGETPPLIFPIL